MNRKTFFGALTAMLIAPFASLAETAKKVRNKTKCGALFYHQGKDYKVSSKVNTENLNEFIASFEINGEGFIHLISPKTGNIETLSTGEYNKRKRDLR